MKKNRIYGLMEKIGLFKMIKIMRFTIFILFLSLSQTFAVNSYSQQTKLSLDMRNVSVEDVIDKIEKSSEFFFMYNKGMVDVERKIDIQVDGKGINQILDKIFENTGISYSIKDRQILLINNRMSDTGNESINQQQKTISGKVSDSTGASLPGVSVVVKGTTTGVISDMDGKYTITKVPDNATLQFSFVGMKSQEFTVGGKTIINVTLAEETVGIEEVVAVGYGTQIRKNLSSSITKVDPKNLENTSTSFEATLEGRAAGVQLVSGSAEPGSAVRIRIRGNSSASASSDPLYVIDGIPIASGEISSAQPGAAVNEWNLISASSTNVLASLNPNDIESLEILKDASAAAIYGSRGANGVILITTKKGKAGKTKINASASFGLSDATHKISFPNSQQYIKLAQEAWTNSGNSLDNFWTNSGVLVDGLTQEQAMNTNTNWVDKTLQIGNVQNYNISISGGNEKTTFFISSNLKKEKSILRGGTYMQYGTRLNIEHQVSDRFRIGGNMMLSHIENKPVPSSWSGGVGLVHTMLPIWPVYKTDGTYFKLSSNNPVAGVDLREMNLTSNQITGNWFLKANIIKGLTFRTEFGTNLLFNNDFQYRDGRITSHGRSVSDVVEGNGISSNWKNILNYTKSVNGHSFDILAAAESQSYRKKENTMFGDTYFNTALKMPQDAAIKKAVYTETGYSFLSYISRLNYDYKSRYLLSLSMRVDGSSRFAPNNRWGYFPASSIGYTLSEEKFFKPLKSVFNYMKFRASYGLVGNSEIGNYTYYSSYATTSYNNKTGIKVGNIGDDKLGWETTAQLDLGISWEAFDKRLSGEIDYYDKKTTNLLLPYPVSNLTGVTSVTKNVGELSNKGFEFMINSMNIKGKNFTWETNITLAHNENKIVKLSPNLTGGIYSSAGLLSVELYEGYPVGVKARTIWGGVDPATGEDTYIEKDGTKLLYSQVIAKYKTLTGFNASNSKPTGNPWPKFTGGIDNRFTWKNWYANALFTFATGMDFEVGNEKRSVNAFGNVKYNPYTNVLDHWTKPGDVTPVHRLTTNNVDWTATTQFLHKIDYIRLKDLVIGYRIKTKTLSLIQGVNCYLKFTNLLTFTKAPSYYWDPEFTNNNNSSEANFVDSGTPQAKMCIFGMNIDF